MCATSELNTVKILQLFIIYNNENTCVWKTKAQYNK